MISIDEALQRIAKQVEPLGTESIPLAQGVGRVLAEAVTADVDSPPHTKSVMDGFAVRAADLTSGEPLGISETIVAGDTPQKELVAGMAARIMTGAPLPKGADAVVMIEQATILDAGAGVTFDVRELTAGKHVMQQASSFARGEMMYDIGHTIRALDIGLLAEVGAHTLTVQKLPSAAVIPTGNELVDASEKPGDGQIRNSNGPMLVALLQKLGLQVIDIGIGRDDPADLSEKIAAGLNTDLLLLSGGVSAGMLDLVPGLLHEAGVEQVFHKVRIKPGKPIWFGQLHDGQRRCCVFGLPGNPVSSLVGLEIFVQAAVRRMLGRNEVRRPRVIATLTADHETRGGRPTFWPGVLLESGDTTERRVRPLSWMGSSDLRSLGLANALIYFPSEKQDYRNGETVSVLPLD